MNTKQFFFNWKMNPVSLTHDLCDAYSALAQKNTKAFTIFPPTVYIQNLIAAGISPSQIGVQAISHTSDTHGAYTGQISAGMISHLYGSLVGHSETRIYFNHGFEEFKMQALHLLSHNLGCVYCVGHSDTRDKDIIEARALKETCDLISFLREKNIDMSKLIIAYEPIWAIGTGVTATTSEIDTYFAHMRTVISSLHNQAHPNLLYGGSVSSQTIDEQMHSTHIDGFLIGGASLKPTELAYFAQYMA